MTDLWAAYAETDAQWIERRFAEEMAACERAWSAGLSAAVADAVSWCRTLKRPPPPWLDQAVRSLAERQTPAEVKRQHEAMVHCARWSAVTELRERKDELAEAAAKAGTVAIASWEQTYAAVSKLLAKTEAAGSPDTIAASYKLVQKDTREGRGAKYWGSPRPLRVTLG